LSTLLGTFVVADLFCGESSSVNAAAPIADGRASMPDPCWQSGLLAKTNSRPHYFCWNGNRLRTRSLRKLAFITDWFTKLACDVKPRDVILDRKGCARFAD